MKAIFSDHNLGCLEEPWKGVGNKPPDLIGSPNTLLKKGLSDAIEKANQFGCGGYPALGLVKAIRFDWKPSHPPNGDFYAVKNWFAHAVSRYGAG